MSVLDPQLLLRNDSLCVFISKRRTDHKFPPARDHDASSHHEGPRLSGDPAGVRVRAGALHHPRPAAGDLSGPPEAHHVHGGGECGARPPACVEALSFGAHVPASLGFSFQGPESSHHLFL